MFQRLVAPIAALSLLAGCSSRPREFNPVIAAAAPDRQRLEAAATECRDLLVAGKLDQHGRLASAGAGAAAGATTLAVGSAAASSAGLYGGMAVLGATLVALPVVALGGAFGLAKAKQKKKERAIQAAMAGCLQERGFAVTGWSRKGKVVPARSKGTPAR